MLFKIMKELPRFTLRLKEHGNCPDLDKIMR